ncbi:LacI family DNA-binding transcriptional regulator [Brachybacterium hainanense]|uniref:LacI family DNA-binding transcriptional regulator n=1 Tax=Brachybacterium hainanense TaxID=1541174 RepID=A0ABV6R6E7_9MICO
MPSDPPARRRPPRLRDVAELAGVSVKSVSNVVNDFPHISAPMRAKVEAAIEELGYRPQIAGKQLRAGTSGIITLAVPSLTFSYFSDVAQRFIDEARTRHRTILLHSTSAGLEQELELIAGHRVGLGDGVIYNPLLMPLERLRAIANLPQPMVLIGEHVDPDALPHGVDYVRIDNRAAMAEATAHLLAADPRRIAFLGQLPAGDLVPEFSTAALRTAGFRDAVAAAGRRAPDVTWASVANWHRSDGRAATHALLEAHPEVDAIVAANDELALGALTGLRDRGLRVPEDVAVVGFDDIPETPYASPALSTISQDKTQLARRALDLLLERIDGHDGPGRTVTVAHRLVVRESSRRA